MTTPTMKRDEPCPSERPSIRRQTYQGIRRARRRAARRHQEGTTAMTRLELPEVGSARLGRLTAGIFDVDGVLLASPHEQAWREALVGFAEPRLFTTAMYQAHVAGKPRLSGARAALEALGVPDADQRSIHYAECKQER